MKKTISRGIVAIFTYWFIITAASACWISWYQAEMPQKTPKE